MPHNEDGEFRLDGEDKFAERVKGWKHKKLMNKVVYADWCLRAVSEAEKENDPRSPHAKQVIKRQREIVVAEIERRKAEGIDIPPVRIEAESIKLGGSAKMG